MRKPLVATLTFALIGVLVAGCGDDDGGGNDAVEAEGGDGDGLAVGLTDFEFSPDELEGAAGETVSIQLENTGSARHTFTGDGVDEEVAAGDSATVEVTLPDSGSFDFFCRFHQGQGMVGSITTGAAPAADTATTSAPEGAGVPGPGY